MDVDDPLAQPLPPVVFPPLQMAQHTAPRVWTVFVAYALSLVSALVFSQLVLAAVTWASLLPERRTREVFLDAYTRLSLSATGILASGLASCLSFALLALVCASVSTEMMGGRLRIGRRPWWFAWGVVAAIGMLGIGEMCSGVIAFAGLERVGALAQYARAFAHPTLATLVGAVGIIGVGAGAGEELLFRGYIQTRLAQRWGAAASVLVSAALFGVAHFDPVHSTFAFLAGLLLGWVSLRTGTIRVTIVAHVINNLASLAQIALSDPDAPTARGRAIGGLALGAACVIGCVAALLRANPEDAE